MQPQIFVIGSFVMGLTIRAARLPVAGETLMGHGSNLGVGGKGFNQAVAASRAGTNVQIILCIGRDTFGKIARETLEKEHIATDYLFELENESSGCGFVTLLDSGENTIIIDAAANNKLTPEMVKSASGEIAKSKILMAQLEVSDDTVEEAFILAKAHNCLTILNPAPARKIPLSILKNTDILTPNETEAKIILGLPPGDNISPEAVAEKLLLTGVKTIIMTRGKKGALIISEKEMINICAQKIETTDPTGCGDCFNGNLAHALAKGNTIKEAVESAVYAGTYCAQYLGVIDGLPTSEELLGFIKSFQK